MTTWTVGRQAPLSSIVTWSLSCPLSQWCYLTHLVLCHPLLLLPSIFLSIRVFSNESALCIRWPEYWSFSFDISPSSEYSGLISFRIDWFDLTLQRLSRVFFSTAIQKHHFLSAQLSLWCNSQIHTWLLEKNIALTECGFVRHVMSRSVHCLGDCSSMKL